MMRKVTEEQVLAAKIRAERDSYELKHRKACEGGWTMPTRDVVYRHLSKMFGLSEYELSFYFTYSRRCSHTWAEGACPDCPVPNMTSLRSHR